MALETTMVRRQLGRKLRTLRERSGKTVVDVAKAKLASGPKLWRIESGKQATRVADAKELARFFDADAETVELCGKLAEATQGRNFSEDYSRLNVSEGLDLYLSLEATAAEIRFYDPDLLPGLFQTREHTARIYRVMGTAEEASEQEIDEFYRLRLDRRQNLFDRSDVKYQMIIGQTVLTRLLYSSRDRHLYQDQVDLLTEAMELHGIDVRVLPLNVGVHAGQLGGFTLMDFSDPEDPSVVSLESPLGLQHEERKPQVDFVRGIWNSLYRQAIPLREELSHHEPNH